MAEYINEDMQMGITVTWDNDEKTTLLVSYKHPWTLADFDAAQTDVQRLAATVSQRVDILRDITDGGTPPPNAMRHFMQAAKTRLANQGTTIFIGADLFAKTLAQTVEKVTQSAGKRPQMRFVATREEAYTLLKDLQENL